MAVKKANYKKTTEKKPAVVKKASNQHMVSFEQAFKNYWIKYFDFKGCAQRSEFWWMWLFNMCVTLFVFLIEIGISKQLAGGLNLAWSLATFIPGISLLVRRLHDVGFSGWWVVLFIVVVILGMFGPVFAVLWFLMSLLILVLLVMPSRFDENKYRK